MQLNGDPATSDPIMNTCSCKSPTQSFTVYSTLMEPSPLSMTE